MDFEEFRYRVLNLIDHAVETPKDQIRLDDGWLRPLWEGIPGNGLNEIRISDMWLEQQSRQAIVATDALGTQQPQNRTTDTPPAVPPELLRATQ